MNKCHSVEGISTQRVVTKSGQSWSQNQGRSQVGQVVIKINIRTEKVQSKLLV